MKKVLGSRDQYYSQLNDAQYYLFADYYNRPKSISCGPNSFVMGLDICGWPMDVFTPGEQASDSVVMIAHNPYNLKRFKKARDIDYDAYPPNEVPQIYPVIAEIIYVRDDICSFKWGLNIDIVKSRIDQGIPVMVSGSFPCGGHYVLIVGYDGDNLIFNDPYPIQWDDKNGYNRIMTHGFFKDRIQNNGYRIEIYPYKEETL